MQSYGLEELQKIHLEMLIDLREFCEKHKIEWSLAYGSVLGARRHSGPIPWDDDVDVMMTVPNYEKFRDSYKNSNMITKYYLEEIMEFDGMISMAKIRKNNTTFIEKGIKTIDGHNGIFIDIFILHNAPNDKKEQKKSILISNMLVLKWLSNKHYTKRKLVVPLMFFLRLFGEKHGIKKKLEHQYKYDSMNTEKVAVWEWKTKILDKKDVLPYVPIQYAGETLYAPKNTDKYLEVIYGDWRKIPTDAEIAWAQHGCWSISEGYDEYIKKNNNRGS